MRATDIDRVASAVMGSLAGSNPGLLGCGAISSPLAYACSGEYECLPDGYECGGAASFDCTGWFGCDQAFNCQVAPASGFTCISNYECAPVAAFAGG